MEWIGGALAGLVAGFFSALVAPFAKERAAAAREHEREVTAAKRAVVTGGRALVADAYRWGWQLWRIERDQRYGALRQYLSVEVRSAFEEELASLRPQEKPLYSEPFNRLLEEVDRLEREWNLI